MDSLLLNHHETDRIGTERPKDDCRDVWNAFMLRGAHFSRNDIPFCPTTACHIPEQLIVWEEAKTIYHRQIRNGEPSFSHPAFVCFYQNDYKFDGKRGIWSNYKQALAILSHFSGVITPDFSTYQDFPEPLKIYNTYRMRAFGYWLGTAGQAVINNVRWGTPETYRYCFDGIPRNSVVAIGTCGGSPRRLADRDRFESGLTEMVRVLSPHTILVYGSANYPCFDLLIRQGIEVVAFPGKTAQAFERRRCE